MAKEKSNKKKSFISLLKDNGFLLPTTDEDIIKYEKMFGNTDIILPEEVDSPNFIFENHRKAFIRQKEKTIKNSAKIVNLDKPSNVDYYKRTVLAAEIVYELHKEWAFGHLKLQKLIYLALRIEKIQLPVNFLKQAMGPYDNQLMRSIDKQLLSKKWFEFKQTESLKYQPLENAGQHKKDFEKYFGHQKDKIYWLIEIFRKVKSDRIEIITTLFACWEEILNEKEKVTDDILLEKFFNWSEFKEKFSKESVLKEIPWMIDNSLIPSESD
jgi:type I restriction enzyme, S subunit